MVITVDVAEGPLSEVVSYKVLWVKSKQTEDDSGLRNLTPMVHNVCVLITEQASLANEPVQKHQKLGPEGLACI